MANNIIKKEILDFVKFIKPKVEKDKLSQLNKVESIIKQAKIPDDIKHFDKAAYLFFLLSSGFKQMSPEVIQRIELFGDTYHSLPEEEKSNESKQKNRPPSGTK